ncbi:MAG: hypothetical protein IT349_03255 [Candidatus Eisenbacteria bacterium]|nr:hypothetical protein [Candidatus Eisenbacteria bacterium]MCC7141098.1 hypothetical protein [Candidatus Eisenbacteria bacterium]
MSRRDRIGAALRRALVAALLAGGLLSGCETRDPKNPLDPNNPDTGGTPALLNAIAEDAAVELRWDLGPLQDVSGVRVIRGSSAAGEHTLLEESGRGSGAFRDAKLINLLEYHYRLEIRDPRGRWMATLPDSARPGPAEPWVIDLVNGGLLGLSPDGRDRRTRLLGSRQLLDLAVVSDGSLWVADYFRGELLHLRPSGEGIEVIEQPAVNAVVLEEEWLWTGSFLGGQVSRLRADGSVAFIDSSAGRVEDLFRPAGETGVWVAARDSLVSRIGFDSVRFRLRSFVWPVALAADSLGVLYVADRGAAEVYRVARDGSSVTPLALGFVQPVDLAADGAGGVWVADPGRGELIHIDAAGLEERAIALGPVDSVTRDPALRELWVTAGNAGMIYRLDDRGEVRVRNRTGGRPVRVDAAWR